MKKLIRVLSLVGVLYVLGGCKAADPATPPVAASYLGKWGNDRDICGGPDQTLQREYTVTFNEDKTLILSGYSCDLKGRLFGTYTYAMTNNTFKLKFVKGVNADGTPLPLPAEQIKYEESILYTIFVSADEKKMILSPGFVDNAPAAREFVKR